MSDQKAVVLELIDGFNAIDLDRVIACFDEHADYHNIPMEKVTGTDAIRGVLQGFMGSASAVQWDLLNIGESDGVVLTERVDKFEVNGAWIALPVMGIFEVSEGKITAWRDYFDLADFQSQFAKATAG
ncbi:MAG: limonene-1,2-epoxide hydrolase [Gammaproteobacteria bacterium]|nr:limonene-1,2-epoxide hydrolase [Gammaproteobacteria bacterium]|tara:strand:- start:824 stop:1207 length:384 start_codon:yes stop_codon:yes gene_type:complete